MIGNRCITRTHRGTVTRPKLWGLQLPQRGHPRPGMDPATRLFPAGAGKLKPSLE